MATTGETPHVNDLDDEAFLAIVRACDDWRDLTDRIRGARSALKERTSRLGVSDELADGSDMLRAAGIYPKGPHGRSRFG